MHDQKPALPYLPQITGCYVVAYDPMMCISRLSSPDRYINICNVCYRSSPAITGIWDLMLCRNPPGCIDRSWFRSYIHIKCETRIGPASTPASHRYRELAVKRERSGAMLLLLLELGLPNELAWPITAFVCWLGDTQAVTKG